MLSKVWVLEFEHSHGRIHKASGFCTRTLQDSEPSSVRKRIPAVEMGTYGTWWGCYGQSSPKTLESKRQQQKTVSMTNHHQSSHSQHALLQHPATRNYAPRRWPLDATAENSLAIKCPKSEKIPGAIQRTKTSWKMLEVLHFHLCEAKFWGKTVQVSRSGWRVGHQESWIKSSTSRAVNQVPKTLDLKAFWRWPICQRSTHSGQLLKNTCECQQIIQLP